MSTATAPCATRTEDLYANDGTFEYVRINGRFYYAPAGKPTYLPVGESLPEFILLDWSDLHEETANRILPAIQSLNEA
ncbi:hypothetical protein CLV58_12526 [Spirosoma oryzae]|uniref:Uncharacterized protein n=1 Tax=Spirosoma oryzae TaxID=1469603 RepID=A0A2T0S8K1_9BACT|nr:hypothetical protein [Spirosoma oryzae]PRY29764.1 hypothetical protein CLV58_12526 [Spirosoma oryzae]